MTRKKPAQETKVTEREASVAMAELGRIGGLRRAQRMTPEERRASALKASKAAAMARQKKAQK